MKEVCRIATRTSENIRYPNPCITPTHSSQIWCSHGGVMRITVLDLTPCCLVEYLTHLSSWVGRWWATESVNFYYTTKHYIPVGSYLHSHRHNTLKSHIVIVYGKAVIRVNFRANLKLHSYRSWNATLRLFYLEVWGKSSEISLNYQTTQHHILEGNFLFVLVQPSVICVCLV